MGIAAFVAQNQGFDLWELKSSNMKPCWWFMCDIIALVSLQCEHECTVHAQMQVGQNFTCEIFELLPSAVFSAFIFW